MGEKGASLHQRRGGKVQQIKFRIHIKNAAFRRDMRPVDRTCECLVCQNYSRAYLRHLYTANELLYFRLATYHNLFFILKLMERIRESISEGSFYELKKEWLV